LAAFTLIELLVVIALVAILAAMLLPAISKAKVRTQGVACLNNNRQLAAAWLLYADDHNDRLPYNLGGPNRMSVAMRTNLNWVNNILNWELDSDNTNTATITEASLGPYASRVVSIYRCPSDSVLSAIQRQARWTSRVRSYSMNAMMGDAGDLSLQGFNLNNPGYVQFFKLSSIPRPASIFVFLDEHPDSINDGYFLNKAEYHEWVDLPASYHDGAATFSFADGHSQMRRWQHARTKRPARPVAAKLPLYVPAAESADFFWIVEHMSVDRH
jgi:prepilin-type N-terminal cleavage/methylation domain-containing protein/prepilin-type processing-associated H-X9-DG protein